MLTLQQNSCLSLVSDEDGNTLPLDDIVKKFDSDRVFRQICSEDPGFWQAVLSNLYGNLTYFSRLDILYYQWLDYARLLVAGVSYKYSIMLDEFNNTVLRGPQYFYLNHPPEQDQDDQKTVQFYLDGSAPIPGSVGYCVEFFYTFHGFYEIEEEEYKVFISSPDKVNEMQQVVMTYIVENPVYKYVEDIEDIEMAGIKVADIDKGSFDRLPHPQEIVRLIQEDFEFPAFDSNQSTTSEWSLNYGDMERWGELNRNEIKTRVVIYPLNF